MSFFNFICLLTGTLTNFIPGLLDSITILIIHDALVSTSRHPHMIYFPLPLSTAIKMVAICIQVRKVPTAGLAEEEVGIQVVHCIQHVAAVINGVN